MSDDEASHGRSKRSHLDADIEMTGDRGLGLFTSADDQQNNDASADLSSMHDDNGNAAHFTYPELYRAAATADVVMFRRSSEDLEYSHHDLKELKSPQGDTVLHIAAQHGHDELVRVILGRHDLYPLIVKPNMFKNTPLHVAAASGHLSTVKILVSVAREIPQQLGASSSSTTTSTDPIAGKANIQYILSILWIFFFFFTLFSQMFVDIFLDLVEVLKKLYLDLIIILAIFSKPTCILKISLRFS